MSDSIQKYLLIENPGVAAVESFTLLGASNKAGTDAIGQFGSGTKFGVLTLLREEQNPVIYAGPTRVEFGKKAIEFAGQEHRQVFVKLSGRTQDGKSVNRTEDLSLVLRYGEIDWTDTRLAYREFVSNALDAVNGDAKQVKVEIVDASKVRAKAGFTRVFLELTPAAEEFHRHLHVWFLHFDPKFVGKANKTQIINKFGVTDKTRVYRRGVFVREVEKKSLFDYNLTNLPLDEARIASDWSVAFYAASAVRNCADPAIYAAVLNASEKVWESDFDLTTTYDYAFTPEKQARVASAWSEAGDKLLGDDCVFVHEAADTSLAEGKGYKVKKLPDAIYKAATARKLRTADTILTADERNGRQVDDATNSAALRLVENVWNRLESLGATRGETLPTIKSFTADISSGGKVLGYYRDGAVFINNCLLGSVGDYSPEAFATALEECAHHITKATDNSRDFQEFFIQIAVQFLHG